MDEVVCELVVLGERMSLRLACIREIQELGGRYMLIWHTYAFTGVQSNRDTD